MLLTSGYRLGPYEIVAPLGAGGMGEVYRARDTRLGRDVALKVLPAAVAGDPERRARFETEARAIAALSHPNVLAVYDLGCEGEVDYVVLEYVEGETLRDRLLEGPLSSGRAVGLATQIARGLAAAHDRGVIHRDLKPENVMLTPDGQAKILDFGLARRLGGEASDFGTDTPTLARATEPGLVLGTMGYMSPEQVRGADVDARSDLFALGALLFEMIAGRRAFRGDTAADAMSATLREDPPELVALVADLPPGLDRIIRRCLEKQPAARFRSAADLAFALESLSSVSSSALPAVPAARPMLSFRRLTYRNGTVANARFAPDGASVLYGASWEGAPFEMFSSYPGRPESRHLGLPPGNVLAVSTTGEMAVASGYRNIFWNQAVGTLGRVPLSGGGVRPLLPEVGFADWSPDSRTMAVIHYAESRCRLEYPVGTVRYETANWLSHVRVSPDARFLAYAEHPSLGDTTGTVWLHDLERGSRRPLGPQTSNVSGIAWSPRGDEVWVSGLDETERHGIRALGLDGSSRAVFVGPVRTTLHDVARDGRVLLSQNRLRIGLNLSDEEGKTETDLSWFDCPVVVDFTPDGRQLLFFEGGEAENPHYGCYLRDVDGGPAVRLGEGTAIRVSPDGQWVIAIRNLPPGELVLHATGFGESRDVRIAGVERVAWAGFHPDGKRLFVVATVGGAEMRVALAGIDDGNVELLWDEEVGIDALLGLPMSADGSAVVLRRRSGEFVELVVATREVRPLPGLGAPDLVLAYAPGGGFLVSSHEDRRQVDRFDPATGERTLWRRITPSDPTGVIYVGSPVFAPGASRYAYSYLRLDSELSLVEGLE